MPSALAGWRALLRSATTMRTGPGERQWVNTKNRATARFAKEREGVGRRVKASAKLLAR